VVVTVHRCPHEFCVIHFVKIGIFWQNLLTL
jgi:hypothetical protein